MPSAHYDGCEIHYETFGDGPRRMLLVMPIGWPGPDLVRRSPYMGAFRAPEVELATYDRRGTARSTPATDVPDLDRHVADLEAVAGALGWERFVLCGVGGGALAAGTAVSYAARHPERVPRMVLWNPNPAFFATEDWPYGMPESAAEAAAGMLSVSKAAGSAALLDFFMPDLPPELREQLIPVIKAGMSDPSFLDTFFMSASLRNPAEDYATVRCPVLCIHLGRDLQAPREAVKWVAETIPDARLVEFPELGWGTLVALGREDEAFDVAADFIAAG